MTDKRVVQVEVHGQTYPIRTELDPHYVEELAQFVQARMALASKSSPASDAVGLAILTALNITDEYFRVRSSLSSGAGAMVERTEALERIVDQALALAE